MIYESPWPLPERKDCLFYHSIDLPIGRIDGDWDLRSCLADYTNRYDFKGKTVLDIGTAGGLLSFYAEQMGAMEVISFDQSDVHRTDSLPEWGFDTRYVAPQKRGYWFAHHHLRSKAQAFYGNIYDLPWELGLNDVAIVGSILLHIENPFGALKSISTVARDIIVTDVLRGPFAFRPEFRQRPNDYACWWSLPPETVSKMLQSLGFAIGPVVEFTATSYIHGTLPLYSITAKRQIDKGVYKG